MEVLSAGLSEVLRSLLDEAQHGLRELDRELVLGRFFEGSSFQGVAESFRHPRDCRLTHEEAPGDHPATTDHPPEQP